MSQITGYYKKINKVISEEKFINKLDNIDFPINPKVGDDYIVKYLDELVTYRYDGQQWVETITSKLGINHICITNLDINPVDKYNPTTLEINNWIESNYTLEEISGSIVVNYSVINLDEEVFLPFFLIEDNYIANPNLDNTYINNDTIIIKRLSIGSVDIFNGNFTVADNGIYYHPSFLHPLIEQFNLQYNTKIYLHNYTDPFNSFHFYLVFPENNLEETLTFEWSRNGVDFSERKILERYVIDENLSCENPLLTYIKTNSTFYKVANKNLDSGIEYDLYSGNFRLGGKLERFTDTRFNNYPFRYLGDSYFQISKEDYSSYLTYYTKYNNTYDTARFEIYNTIKNDVITPFQIWNNWNILENETKQSVYFTDFVSNLNLAPNSKIINSYANTAGQFDIRLYGGGVNGNGKAFIETIRPLASYTVFSSGSNIDVNEVKNITSRVYRRTGGSTVTNFYHYVAEEIDTQIPITNYWGLYINAGAKNYIKNKLLIGTTTDDGSNMLQVQGSIKQTFSLNSIIKSDNTGKLISAVDGTDYISPNYLNNNYWTKTGSNLSYSLGNVGIGTGADTILNVLEVRGDVIFRESGLANTNKTTRFYFGAYSGNRLTGIVSISNSTSNSLIIGGGAGGGEFATQINFNTHTSVGTVGVGNTRQIILNNGDIRNYAIESGVSAIAYNSWHDSSGTQLGYIGFASSSDNILRILNGTADGSISFVTGAATRGLITNSGNFLLGTTTDNGTYRLQVNGSSYFYDRLRVLQTGESAFADLSGAALMTNRSAFYIRPDTNNTKNLYIGDRLNTLRYSNIYLGSTNTYINSDAIVLGEENTAFNTLTVNSKEIITFQGGSGAGNSTSLRLMFRGFSGNRVSALMIVPTSTQNILQYGGGTGLGEAASAHSFFTSSGAGTVGIGNFRLYLDNSGDIRNYATTSGTTDPVAIYSLRRQDSTRLGYFGFWSTLDNILRIVNDNTTSAGIDFHSSGAGVGFRMTSGNSFLVNTTTDNGVDKLQVNGSGYFNGGLVVNNIVKNASAILQADSTTKGFLPPRMTEAQRLAIVSPAEGLIVTQTDATAGLYIYIGATWRAITMV